MKVAQDFDFDMRDLEQNEELTAVSWAENNGWLVRKIQYIGRRGCPDRLFVGFGNMFLIEMKRPNLEKRKGGGLSAGQVEEIKRFRERGVSIYVFYRADDVIAFLRQFMT